MWAENAISARMRVSSATRGAGTRSLASRMQWIKPEHAQRRRGDRANLRVDVTRKRAPRQRPGKFGLAQSARRGVRALHAVLPCLLHRESTRFNTQDSPSFNPRRSPPAAGAVARGRERAPGSGLDHWAALRELGGGGQGGEVSSPWKSED